MPEINFTHLLDTYIAAVNAQAAAAAAAAAAAVNSDQENSGGAGTDDETGNTPPPKVPQTPKKAESKTDPDVGIWVTSDGVYYFKFAHLSSHLQLFYSMLKELYRVPDIDAFSNLMLCLKMMIVHCDCLELANKEQKGFLIYTLEKMLVPRYLNLIVKSLRHDLLYFNIYHYFFSLWKLLSADYCHLNEVGVNLLVHALLYESGRNAFWSLVNRDFNDPNWKVRMQASKNRITKKKYFLRKFTVLIR